MDVYNSIIKLLESSNVKFKTIEHEPVYTSEQAAKARGTNIEQGAKAMIVRSEGTFYMLVLSAAKKIDFKKVKKLLKTKSLSLATAEETEDATGCKPGSVPPFGNLFNMKVFADPSLLEQEIIDFNAGSLTQSIEMKSADYTALIKPEIVDFSQ